MRALEKMITRVKQQMYMGRETIDIFEELVGQGSDESLVHWALRAARFEIDREERLAEEKKQYENN